MTVLPMPSSRLFVIIFWLFAQTQALNHVLVALCILTPQICQMAAALADKFQKAATGMLVMFVGFEMFDKLIDALSQQSHLHLGRAGVVFV
jgi:uncharacterized membrane protein (DUF373 family)